MSNLDPNLLTSNEIELNSGRSTPSQSKSDLYNKLHLVKDNYGNKCYTAPPGMSSKYMEIYSEDYNDQGNHEANYEMDAHLSYEKYTGMYGKTEAHFGKQYDTMNQVYMENGLKKESPSSSKNSSSDSLNHVLRNGPSMNTMSNSDYSMNNFNSMTKKKSLKTTLYRIFTQRKKIQKIRTLQKHNPQLANSDYADQNQLTIKTESDKKVKKK